MKLAFTGLPGSGKTLLMAACAGRKISSSGRQSGGQVILPVPNERVNKLSAMYEPKKTTYAQITFLDPEPQIKTDDPLTKLPSELRQSDGLIQVICNFDSGRGQPKPESDYAAFTQELILNDQLSVERRLERLGEDKKRGRKPDLEEQDLLEKALQILQDEKPLRLDPIFNNHPKLRGFGLLSAKPVLVVCNNEEQDYALPDIDFRLTGEEQHPPLLLPIMATIEAELAELEQSERQAFMEDLNLRESALDRLITAAYDTLGLISFFTVGADEVRAWTVTKGSQADQAAGVIHSDLQKGFIRTEVIRYEDLMALGSEAQIKKAGLMKLCGRDYIVQDGDILHVRFNV